MNFEGLKVYYKLMKNYNNKKIGVSLDYLNQVFLKYVEDTLEIKDSYDRIIKKAVLLLQELKSTNPYLAASLFNHLLWGGYFSANKELVYNQERILLPFFNGAVVTTGNAACLEFSDLEARIISELEFKAYTIICCYNTTEVIAISEIDRKTTMPLETENKEPKSKELEFNHAITLIDGMDGFFLTDPTNIQFLNIKNLIYGKLIFDKSHLILDYASLAVRNDIKTQELVEIIKKIKHQGNKRILTSKKTIEIFKQAKSIFNDNKNIIEDYYSDTKEDIDDVSKKLIKFYAKK